MKKTLFKLILAILLLGGYLTPLAIKAINVNDKPSCLLSKGNYITATFEAEEDDWKCRIYLKYDGTFLMSEKEGRDRTTTSGTYSLSDEITRGGQVYVSFYVDGEYQGRATLVWPLQQDMMLLMNGYTFNKVY